MRKPSKSEVLHWSFLICSAFHAIALSLLLAVLHKWQLSWVYDSFPHTAKDQRPSSVEAGKLKLPGTRTGLVVSNYQVLQD